MYLHAISTRIAVLLISWPLLCQLCYAQQGVPIGVGQGPGNQGNAAGTALGNGLQGGSAQADFDSLIDLIQSTVEPDSWADNGTGEGEIAPFDINGVYADPKGTLKFQSKKNNLVKIWKNPPLSEGQVQGDVRQASKLRFISLRRLESTIRNHQSKHQPLPPEVLTLAGLQRIQYVVVAQNPGDILLAGAAGDWYVRPNGMILSSDTNRPVVRLDDLLTLWRRNQSHQSEAFGCSIIPRQVALAETQEFLKATGANPINPSQRGKWLKELRNTLGAQDVEFFGMSPNSHAANVLLVADYHMKLIGMGIADGVPGVESYLETVRLRPDGSPPPMSILRWWFAMQYEPVEVTPNRDVFQLRGQGVQVLSENELLAARGRRVHTGQSDELNREFATSFTNHFEELVEQYPIYGELQNLFDMALVLSLFKQEGLLERIGWEPSLILNSNDLRLPKVDVPQSVETVINHRVLARRHIIAGISGGVWIDGKKSLKVQTPAGSDTLPGEPIVPQVQSDDMEQWWWDAPTNP